MVDFHVRLEKAGERKARSILRLLAVKAQNLPAGLKTVGEALVDVTKERFDSGTDPQGNKWKKLAPLTVALRGADGPILKRSGGLKRSVTFRVGGNRLSLGPNTVYDAAQQFGATIKPKNGKYLAIPVSNKRGNAVSGKPGKGGKGGGGKGGGFILLRKVTLPPRPYIGFGPKDEQATRDAVEDYLAVEGLSKK